MSTVERPILRSLYATVLRASERLPFPPQTDDEPLADTGESEKVDEGGESQDDSQDKEKNQVEIDLEGLMTRTGVVPLGREGYVFNLSATATQIFFMERGPVDVMPELGLGSAPAAELKVFDMAARTVQDYASDVLSYELSSAANEHAQILILRSGERVSITPTQAAPSATALAEATLKTKGGLKVSVDPPVEWAQMLAETHKLYRDLFYASNMHGVDWEAQYHK